MIVLSLVLNLLVLAPVCLGLHVDAAWARASFGAASPARGVLLAVYLAIAVASALLLAVDEPRGVVALLGVQVVYKLLTPLTVGDLRNPVVRSNLAIAAVHSATLVTIARAA